MLDVSIPAAVDPVAVVPEVVEGISIIHDDDAIVVVDKPVGVAVHPSPGWTGPTVVGHLVAAGFRISTSGAAERQGIVQRLDVGTSGVMVIAKSERAYSVLENLNLKLAGLPLLPPWQESLASYLSQTRSPLAR